jgi:hypothetical protein
MTFKIKMLTAAAVLSLPAAAGAQLTGGATGAVQGQVNTPVQSTVDSARQTVPQPEDTLTRPVQDSANDAQDAASEAQDSANQAQDSANDAAQSAQDAATSSATAQAQAGAQAGPVTQATAADIQAGASVRDQSGGMVGTIESVSAQGAVVSTGTVRAQVPITSFGKNAQGLVLAMTKAQLEAAAGASSPSTPS